MGICIPHPYYPQDKILPLLILSRVLPAVLAGAGKIDIPTSYTLKILSHAPHSAASFTLKPHSRTVAPLLYSLPLYVVP